MAATTIQVQKSTVELLKRIRTRTNSASYDEAITKLARGLAKKSMAGALANDKAYSRKDILRGLRDERDRF